MKSIKPDSLGFKEPASECDEPPPPGQDMYFPHSRKVDVKDTFPSLFTVKTMTSEALSLDKRSHKGSIFGDNQRLTSTYRKQSTLKRENIKVNQSRKDSMYKPS